MANPEPIPQGATIGEPIPQGATIGDAVGAVSTSGQNPPPAAGPADMQQVNPWTGAPATSYQATPQEQIPEGHLAAVRRREEQQPLISAAGKASGATLETSGLAGGATLLSREAAHRVDAYHRAIDAVKSNNWKAAVNFAYAAISGADKNDPLYDAAKGIIQSPWEETKAAYEEAKKGNLGEATIHAATAVPVLGPGARFVGEKTAQDIKEGELSKAAGDVAGFAATLGFGKGLSGEAEEAAAKTGEAATKVRPTTVEIAGEKVPVSTPQLQEQSGLSKVIQKAASKEGAQEFISKEAQPVAARATQSNFSKAALKDVEKLQTIRGDAPAEAPVLNTVDDIASHLRKSAKDTYSKLDDAAALDHQQWEVEHKQWEMGQKEKIEGELPEGSAPSPEPVEPKSFTELQDDISNAEKTLSSKFSSTTDKGAAKDSLPKLKQQMDDFLTKHEDVVDSKELGAADSVWRRSKQYDWIADKMRSATSGTTGTVSALKQKPITLKTTSLEGLPAKFDTEFGEHSFERLLGDDGVKNYNDILNVLRNPIQRSNFTKWASRALVGGAGYLAAGPVGLGAALMGKAGISSLADNLLFNPEFGQKALSGWRAAKTGVSKAAAQVRPTPATSLTLQSGRSLANVYGGAAQPLSEQ